MDQKKVIKIAITEDHKIVRKAIATFINGFGGFDILLNSVNGQDLIQQLGRMNELPDICVLDINMPKMNGFETLDALRQKFPDIKVLILSMYENEQTIIKAFSKGARGYLLKDSEPLDLKQALISVYEGDLYHPDLKLSRFHARLKGRHEPSLPRISEKEMEFLPYCCTELSLKEIAKEMGVALRTVQGYRDSLFDKLGMNTRAGLVIYAITTGLVPMRY
ncbi:MAG: response regulator transcription factor [Sphingobacteriales bacterium]|nr:MAG: response regulator transcription factor [Sphingobacteriales bacterium]